MAERPDWHLELTEKDWLFDGSPIRGATMLEMFRGLDWSKAWIDMGPSPAGNLGPYWKVPLRDADTVHRLYPKLLTTKWLALVRHAIETQVARERTLIAAVVATAGGEVEGLPTGDHNILQRIRQLLEIEKSSLHIHDGGSSG